MATPHLHFTKDPSEDITNAPRFYHDFKGQKLRIQLHWTAAVAQSLSSVMSSMVLVRRAEAILKKYTLGLDYQPFAPEALHNKLRAEIIKRASRHPLIKQVGGHIQGPVRTAASEILGGIVDEIIDQAHAKAFGLVNYNLPLAIPYEGQPDIKQFKDLRALMKEPPENRLIVVFAEIKGLPSGQVELFHDWLPWVVVDPSRATGYGDASTLLHEIGHACRLAHQEPPRNIMAGSSSYSDHLWGWQVDTIFDSYWCTGPRPRNWSVRQKIRSEYHPFLWEEDV